MDESISAIPRRARWDSAELAPPKFVCEDAAPVFWSPIAEDSITGCPLVFFTIARRPDLLALFLQGRLDMLDRRQVLAGLGTMAITAIASRSLWAAAPIKIDDSSALLVIDVQNCFLPGGSLAVKDGDQVVPVINRLAKGFANVVMTQDWHTAGHVSFASSHAGKKPFETIDLAYGKQVLWPDHCVQGTDGASLSKDLSIPQAELVIRKGYHKDVDSYSAFTEADGKTTTGLAAYLKARKLQRLFIAGLATDFCVAWTAMDARKAGFETYVIEDGCRGIDTQGSLAKAWADMAKAGVKRIQSSDVAV
jgi:nicotinamidase/pyrazinamidase